jgi:AcrR family transcriptional regulator
MARARTVISEDELVDTAAAVVAQQGLTGAYLQEVARAAGVSVGTIYNHFPSKDHLVRAIGRRVELDFVDAMDTAAPAGKPLRAALPRLTAAVFGVARTSPLAHLLAVLPPAHQAPEAADSLIRAWIAQRVRIAQAAGEVVAVDADLVADLACALVKAGIGHAEPPPGGQQVRDLVCSGLASLLPPTPGTSPGPL